MRAGRADPVAEDDHPVVVLVGADACEDITFNEN